MVIQNVYLAALFYSLLDYIAASLLPLINKNNASFCLRILTWLSQTVSFEADLLNCVYKLLSSTLQLK